MCVTISLVLVKGFLANVFTGYSCCCLLCQQTLFLLLQVLQLSLVFPLELIYDPLMGLLHGCKAPLAGGLWERKYWFKCVGFWTWTMRFFSWEGPKTSRPYKMSQRWSWRSCFQQMSCKLQLVSHKWAEPAWKSLRGMRGYTIHLRLRREGGGIYILPWPTHIQQISTGTV